MEFNKKLLNNTICIFHCGDIKIFTEILYLYPEISFMKLIITYYKKDYREPLNNLKTNLDIVCLIEVENRGMDIGGFLKSIAFLYENRDLYSYKTRFLKLHTKSLVKNKEWTLNLINEILLYDMFDNKNPVIFGSDNFIYDKENCNTINLNYKYMKNIYSRNEDSNIQEINSFFDIYNDKYLSNEEYYFNDLTPSTNFYTTYHCDLDKSCKLHWETFGKKEQFRISNINYINTWAKNKNKFIAGTIFGFNKRWLEIFMSYNLNYEFNILEEEYVTNLIPRKVHSWEYYFGLITLIKNGIIIGLSNNKKIKIYKKEVNNVIIPKCSNININFLYSKIAIFIPIKLIYNKKSYVINLINKLNLKKYSLDIYIGECIKDLESYDDESVHRYINDVDEYGLTKDCHDIDMCKVTNYLKNYINLNYNNYYLGLKCQRNYDILISSNWILGEIMYNNKKFSKNILNLINENCQNITNDNFKKCMKNSFHKEFKYYINEYDLVEGVSQLVNSQNLKNDT